MKKTAMQILLIEDDPDLRGLYGMVYSGRREQFDEAVESCSVGISPVKGHDDGNTE